jgi:PAS domain-containing protein
LKYCITHFVYQAQRNINGEIEGVAVIANEVTPQALANINLKESEERFRSLSNNVPVHIFIIEPMKKPASVTGIKLVGLQGKVLKTLLVTIGIT